MPEKAKVKPLSKETRRAKALRADPRKFPKMLYKSHGSETLIVENPVALKAALTAGWQEKP